jgi:hypothetical protein
MPFKIKHPSFEVIVDIPANPSNQLMKLIICYLEKSNDFANYVEDTLSVKATTVRMFYEFLEDTGNLNKSIMDLPNMLFNVFAKWCGERRTIIRGNGEGARNRALNIMQIINKALGEFSNVLGWSNLERAKTQRLNDSFNIQKRPSKKRAPLSGLAGKDCPYSDKQLFQSLRYVNAWLIIEESRQRELVLASSSVCSILEKIRNSHTPDELMTMRSFSHFSEFIKRSPKHPSHLTCIDDLVQLAQSVNEVSDIYVKEGFIRSMSLLQSKTLSKAKVIDLSNRIIFNKNSYYPFSFDIEKPTNLKGNRVSAQFKRFTPFELLFPSHVNVTSMINLLASERIQYSGLTRLCLDDVKKTIDPIYEIESIEFDFSKVRAFSDFSTMQYKSNDKNPLVYKAYNTYLKSITSCQRLLPIEYRGASGKNKPIIILNALLPKYSTSMFEGKNYHISEGISFRLLSDENSLLRKKINLDAGDKQNEFVDPFCWLLKHIIDSYTGTRKGSDRTCRVKEGNLERLYLSTEYIGNSRVTLEKTELVTEFGSDLDKNKVGKRPFSLNSDLSDVAFLTAHKTKTKYNVYLDRLPEKERVEFIESAPIRVAELMEIDAMKLSKLKDTSKVFTVYEAKKILGLLNVDELYMSVDETLIGLDGEIKNGDETLYISTVENAALITRHIKHYESEIPRLLQNHPEHRTRIMDALLACYNLQLVLKKFPQNIVERSRNMAANLANELFPPLV